MTPSTTTAGPSPEVPAVPVVLADVGTATTDLPAAEPGAAWRLAQEPRDLDANLVRLPAGGRNEPFDGPGLDVLVHVVAGDGTLHTADGDLAIRAGQLLWLPKHSRRGFTAGKAGLAWLTVHHRKPGLSIGRHGGAPTP